jgi:hypothetical protein
VLLDQIGQTAADFRQLVQQPLPIVDASAGPDVPHAVQLLVDGALDGLDVLLERRQTQHLVIVRATIARVHLQPFAVRIEIVEVDHDIARRLDGLG